MKYETMNSFYLAASGNPACDADLLNDPWTIAYLSLSRQRLMLQTVD
jgi:hypothetical protein